MQPPVAVIMRTKDRPQLLRRAIGSVLAQTFTGWHLTIVNDGGDRTTVEAVVSAFPDLGARADVLHNHEPHGRSAALNQGIKASDSALLAIHDDDDSWHPDFLARTVAHLQSTSDAAVLVRTELIWERVDGDEVTEEAREKWAPEIRAFTLSDMLAYNRAIPISVLYRRAVHDEIGYFREDIPFDVDWEFWLRLALLPDPLGFIDGETLAYWHQRRGAVGPLLNSVISHDGLHQRTDQQIRDEALRAYARQDGLGVPLYLTALVRAETARLEEMNTQLLRRMERLEQTISDKNLVSLALRLYRRFKARRQAA
jgi:glycosyltransferase involved in cell wall biosynthesis